MAGRNGQVARIYALLNLIEGSPQGLTVVELKDRINDRGHDVQLRTIYRDLEALSAAGFPLFSKTDESGDTNGARWVLERSVRINNYLALAPREVVGLYLARQALGPLRNTPFYADLQQLFAKIESKLGGKSQAYLEEVSNEIRLDPGPAWGLGLKPEVLDTVHAACAEGMQLGCLYASASSETRARKLGPHYLYLSKGALYLVAEDLNDRQVKVFSVARMSDVEMLSVSYEGERSDPDEYFRHSFGTYRGAGEPEAVVLTFTPALAAYVGERSWHQSQKAVKGPGGSLALHLHVTVTPELVNWVLGFGANVVVNSPPHLREAVRAAAEAIVQNYAPGLHKVS